MKPWLLVVLFALVANQGCGNKDGDRDGDVELGPDFVCQERPDDPTGYLQPICEYLKANLDNYPVGPNTLTVREVVSGEQQTRFQQPEYSTVEYDYVALSCCYTGDWAVMHKATKAVVDFHLGAV